MILSKYINIILIISIIILKYNNIINIQNNNILLIIILNRLIKNKFYEYFSNNELSPKELCEDSGGTYLDNGQCDTPPEVEEEEEIKCCESVNSV